jgi:hypothetical protein
MLGRPASTNIYLTCATKAPRGIRLAVCSRSGTDSIRRIAGDAKETLLRQGTSQKNPPQRREDHAADPALDIQNDSHDNDTSWFL